VGDSSSIYQRGKQAIWRELPRDQGILRADGLAKARELRARLRFCFLARLLDRCFDDILFFYRSKMI
jgi:hypothetical protein